jgi:hypothetical protein
VVEAEAVVVEEEAALQYLVLCFCCLDGRRVDAEVEAEVHDPLWNPQSAKVHVCFCGKDCQSTVCLFDY